MVAGVGVGGDGSDSEWTWCCFEADKKVLSLMVVMAAEFYERANWEFFMACELNRDKAATFFKSKYAQYI